MEDKITTTSCTEETVHEQTPRVKNGDSGADFDYVDAGKAFEKLKPVLEKMDREDVLKMNINLLRAVLNAFKLARAYKKDREQFEGRFVKSTFDPDLYDDITERAMALWYADINVRQSTDPVDLHIIIDKAIPVHNKLQKAANYLWDEDPELGDVVAAIRRGRSHPDMADDILSMVNLFESRWAYAKDRCDISEEDLVEARVLGIRIMEALNNTAEETVLAARRDIRSRAATWLRMGVDDVRAAASYIFRENPEEMERYPSLFSGRRRPQSEDEEETEEKEASGTEETADEAENGAPVALPAVITASSTAQNTPSVQS